MTLEEARIELQAMKDTFEEYEPGGSRCQMALKVALTALLPVSREQVEKVWPGCEMCADWKKLELKPCANGDLGVRADIGSTGEGDPFGLVVYDRYLASGYVDFAFCPFCGAPKTDKAMEITMRRSEALKDGL